MSRWREVTLGEICSESGGGIQTGPFGSQLHAHEYSAVGTPVVMPTNIAENFVDPTGIARVAPEVVARLRRHVLAQGDIIYSRRGDVERRALIRADSAGWLCGTGCLRVRIGSDRRHDPAFMSYALGTAQSRAWIVRHAVGATMQNLNTGILSAVPLRVPDVGEQRAIAEVLGALDDKIAANRRLADAAINLADAVFVAAAAEAVETTTIFAEIADVGGGSTPRTGVDEYWNGEVAWATPTDVTALQAPYLTLTSRTITESGLQACASSLYPTGSVLMTSRATIGAFAIAQRPLAVNQGFVVVNGKDDVPNLWLFHEMRRRTAEFVAHANGATFLELSRGRFKSLPVSLPAASVRLAFAERAGVLHQRAAVASSENDRLARTRDELLPLLMSGKVQIKDAEKVVEGVV
ncbi:MAG: restriction endonuclease subunit S [Dermatophilaceae bacterium]